MGRKLVGVLRVNGLSLGDFQVPFKKLGLDGHVPCGDQMHLNPLNFLVEESMVSEIFGLEIGS